MRREIYFFELGKMNINIENISCVEHLWNDCYENRYINGRNENIISYTVNGKKQLFNTYGYEPALEAHGESVFFISSGTPYISKVTSVDKSVSGRTVCVKFKLTDEYGENLIIRDK